jgi:hypothetical protein
MRFILGFMPRRGLPEKVFQIYEEISFEMHSWINFGVNGRILK